MLFDLLELIFGVAGAGIESAVKGAAERSRLASNRRARLRSLRQQVDASRLFPLAECPEGLAALEGRARPLALEVAPLSGRPAIGYRLRVEGDFLEDNAKRVRQLVDLCSLQEHELVEPASGRVARISPARCLALLAPEPTVPLELAEVIKPPLAPVIDRALVSPSDLATALALRAVEYLLEPGEPLFAYGVARRELEPGAEVGYRETPYRVVLEAPPGGVLILADRPREALLAALESEWELLPE